jgi:hypothetical protein
MQSQSALVVLEVTNLKLLDLQDQFQLSQQ